MDHRTKSRMKTIKLIEDSIGENLLVLEYGSAFLIFILCIYLLATPWGVWGVGSQFLDQELPPTVVEAWSLNHWTTREVPGNDFLDTTLKVQSMKEIIDKLGFIKIKNVCSAQNNVKNMRR